MREIGAHSVRRSCWLPPHAIYSKAANVYLETAADKLTALQQAIDNSGFFANVETVLAGSDKSRDQFLIAIKPNIMTASVHEDASPVYTDPELVEYLLDLLRARGFSRLAVVEAHNVYDYSYQGRTVPAVAAMAGYSGDGYTIEDLTEQKAPWDYGGVLGHHSVGRTWRDADYRISFAKNKTHWQCFYTGCLKNIYGCLPEWDKMKHYHGRRREFFECDILILDAFPVHFGFLDAWVSGDGLTGHVRDADPNHTHTIFASENIFALDWIMGLKMSLDPMDNVVIQEAMRRWGSVEATPVGDTTPWHPWRNVRPMTVKLLDIGEEFYWTSYVLSRALASKQDPRFKPVSRWQFLFGGLQKLAGALEGLTVKTI
jgi:uncharacterized protein (DUF362 family)